MSCLFSTVSLFFRRRRTWSICLTFHFTICFVRWSKRVKDLNNLKIGMLFDGTAIDHPPWLFLFFKHSFSSSLPLLSLFFSSPRQGREKKNSKVYLTIPQIVYPPLTVGNENGARLLAAIDVEVSLAHIWKWPSATIYTLSLGRPTVT